MALEENNELQIEEFDLEPIDVEEPDESINKPEVMRQIEAILFAAGYPVSYKKIGSVLNISAGAIKSIVLEYAEAYNSEVLPRGVILVAFDASCQLCTNEKYGSIVREALGIKRGGNLSQSSLETLSIIAYNEPVTKAFIETVRGVDSTYTLSNLLEKQLVEISGRLDVPGRPNLYSTTESFLRVFGLTSLNELPVVDVDTVGTQEKIDFNSNDETNNTIVE